MKAMHTTVPLAANNSAAHGAFEFQSNGAAIKSSCRSIPGGAALNFAASLSRYTLSDGGTWISFKNKRDLGIA
jgi:ABC-type tungstate transport system permease subunit